MVNEKGFEMQGHAPYCASKNVGPQGTGGKVEGQTVMAVSNPKGVEPQKLGTVALDSLVMPQNGVMPKVGE